MRDDSPVVIATAPTVKDAVVLQGLLRTDGIPTFEKGGAGYGVYGVAANVQIAVAPSDVSRAREILEREGIDLSGEYAPDEGLITDLNRFWPRGEPALRILAWGAIILFAAGLALSLLFALLFDH